MEFWSKVSYDQLNWKMHFILNYQVIFPLDFIFPYLVLQLLRCRILVNSLSKIACLELVSSKFIGGWYLVVCKTVFNFIKGIRRTFLQSLPVTKEFALAIFIDLGVVGQQPVSTTSYAGRGEFT